LYELPLYKLLLYELPLYELPLYELPLYEFTLNRKNDLYRSSRESEQRHFARQLLPGQGDGVEDVLQPRVRVLHQQRVQVLRVPQRGCELWALQ
jgi:hypothetical protein